MKMKYVKPAIMVERFGLTQSITLNCHGVGPGGAGSLGKHTQWDGYTCTWEISGYGKLFMSDGTVCTVENGCIPFNPNTDSIEGYCYNNIEGNVSMFASY